MIDTSCAGCCGDGDGLSAGCSMGGGLGAGDASLGEGLGTGDASLGEGLGTGEPDSTGLGEGEGVSAKAMEEDAKEPTRQTRRTSTWSDRRTGPVVRYP